MMDKRTRAALRQQNEEFERNHAGDSDEELLAMVRARAQILGHAPQMCEVVGAHMVARRFGNWTKVLHRLGYKSASGTQILERSQRYKFEYARQQAIYRTERREKNEKRIARRRMKTAKVSEPEDEKPTENREKNRATE